MVPRVAMLTTATETRLTMSASENIRDKRRQGGVRGSRNDQRRSNDDGSGENGCRKFETQIHARSFRFVLGVNQGRTFPSGPDVANIVRDITRKTALGGPC